MDDRELRNLAREAGRGDVDAAEELMGAIHDQLFGLLHLLGVPQSDIDDVGQDVALKIYTSLPRYDPQKPFLPWMRTIARRTAANYWRNVKRDRDHFAPFREHVVEEMATDETIGETLGSRLEKLAECVERLQERQRQVVRLRYNERLTSRDIAGHLNVRPQSVRNMLMKIRVTLRRCMGSADGGRLI